MTVSLQTGSNMILLIRKNSCTTWDSKKKIHVYNALNYQPQLMSVPDFWNYQTVSFSLGQADALLSSSNGKLEIQPLNGGMNPPVLQLAVVKCVSLKNPLKKPTKNRLLGG